MIYYVYSADVLCACCAISYTLFIRWDAILATSSEIFKLKQLSVKICEVLPTCFASYLMAYLWVWTYPLFSLPVEQNISFYYLLGTMFCSAYMLNEWAIINHVLAASLETSYILNLLCLLCLPIEKYIMFYCTYLLRCMLDFANALRQRQLCVLFCLPVKKYVWFCLPIKNYLKGLSSEN